MHLIRFIREEGKRVTRGWDLQNKTGSVNMTNTQEILKKMTETMLNLSHVRVRTRAQDTHTQWTELTVCLVCIFELFI